MTDIIDKIFDKLEKGADKIIIRLDRNKPLTNLVIGGALSLGGILVGSDVLYSSKNYETPIAVESAETIQEKNSLSGFPEYAQSNEEYTEVIYSQDNEAQDRVYLGGGIKGREGRTVGALALIFMGALPLGMILGKWIVPEIGEK